MALSLRTLLALSTVLCMFLAEGWGMPSAGLPAPRAGPAAPPRQRTKRCSCSSWLDRECIYFCHLDIIWVNTPSKTVPYGLGSPLSRRRRSTPRCACASPSDRTCTRFCHHSSRTPELELVNPFVQSLHSTDRSSANLLNSLRKVVRANARAPKRPGPPGRNGAPGR